MVFASRNVVHMCYYQEHKDECFNKPERIISKLLLLQSAM